METYINHKGYGICYTTFGGKTTIIHCGMPIKTFKALGEMKGRELAKKYIDSL
jgi:hypothetical protein